MKRFSETEKWTKDVWFCNLEPRYKLFWLFLIDNCDNVGVWEVNLRTANFMIGYEYSIESLLKNLSDKVHVFDDGKSWWVKSFIGFQHGKLNPESTSKPVQSYLMLLEKHGLSKLYTKGIHTFQGTERKGKGRVNKKDESPYSDDFELWWASYKKGSKQNAFKSWNKVLSALPEVSELIKKTLEYKKYCSEINRMLMDGQGWLNQKFFLESWTHDEQGTKSESEDSGPDQSAETLLAGYDLS